MTNFLIKYFIQNSEAVEKNSVRLAYGKLGSLVGIVANVFLCIVKIIVGVVFSSVAITADGLNNLSDAGASIISLVGFKLASKEPDKTHPFGHARVEYISALIISFLILLLGVELIKTSIKKIIYPEPIVYSIVMVAVLVVSILAKLWLSVFNKKLGNKIDSATMKATAADSLNDVFATSVVLLAVFIFKWTGWNLDGYMGMVVALFIIYAGIGILRETISPLLGEAPSEELVDKVYEKIMSYDGVLGLHDLVVHDYGPGRCFASVHVEVCAKEDVLKSHDLVDNIERDIIKDIGIEMVIHLDPIVTDDEQVNALKHMVEEIITQIDDTLTIHDFRVVVGNTHSNLIFDVVRPIEYHMNDEELIAKISSSVEQIDDNYYCVITVDKH